MKYSALIGNPTNHSVSYLLYKELAACADIDDFYEHIRINVSDKELEQSIKALRTLHFIGLNVTLPHKLAVIEYLDEIDAVVETIGAVNTIKLGQKTIGYNTDWMGIEKSVRQFGKQATYETATILGSGGAARAAIYACKQLGAKNINVLYRNKNSPKTTDLSQQAEKLGVTLKPYTHIEESVEASQLIINATSAGMIGKEPLPFDLGEISNTVLTNKVFLDAVFNPLDTPLLEYFKTSGAITIDGLWMMIYQGVGALSIWLDKELHITCTDLQRIHSLLKKELHNA
jgi:shikimate dehydrogenase